MKNYRFMFIFDAKLCNPNGDVETGGPRIMPSGRCMVTKQCLAYKLKSYWNACGIKVLHYTPNGESIQEKLGKQAEYIQKALEYIDVRLFGACDLAGKMILKIKGAVTFEHAMSVDNVNEIMLTINRGYNVAVDENGKNIGSGYANLQQILEYGLFTTYGGTNVFAAYDNGLSDDDMDIFFDGLCHVFENDAAAVRPVGSMNARKLIIWSWEGKKQPISDRELKQSVIISRKDNLNVVTDFDEYVIAIKDTMPGVETKIIDI